MEKDQMGPFVRCTEATAPAFRSLVKAWPELAALVRHTQAQGVFPGLRGLVVRLPAGLALEGGVEALAARIAAEQQQEGGHAR